MAEVVPHSISLRSSGDAAATTVPFGSSFLMALAFAAVALGLAILLTPSPWVTPEIPVALFAVALATLGAALVASRRSSHVSSPESSPDRSEPSENPAIPTRSPPQASPRGAQVSRAVTPGKGASWRILSTAPDPGDETWLSWLPRERRRLVPEAGSVAPGVVTSPGRAGNLVAFPVRDYYGGALPPAVRGSRPSPPTGARAKGLVGDEHLPRLSSSHASPFSEEELDRMFPPAGRRGAAILPRAPDRIGGAAPWAKPAGAAGSTDSGIGEVSADVSISSTLAEGSSRDGEEPSRLDRPSRKDEDEPGDRFGVDTDELGREAANPVPPHLRASGPLIRFEPSRPSRGEKNAAVSRSVCASCSRVVVNLRMSGPCPKCLRPVCNECLREAFVTQGHGWCLDCSSASAS